MASKNKKRFAPKPHIKKGDRVIVIAGNDKGKSGTVIEVLPKKNRAVVEGVRIVTKHQKPTQQEQTGGRIEVEAPVHMSNLMHIDPKSGEPTRIGRKEVNGEMVRYAKKSGEII